MTLNGYMQLGLYLVVLLALAKPLGGFLARVYMGPEVVFPPEPYRSRPGYVTRLRAKRFSGVGPWNPAGR